MPDHTEAVRDIIQLLGNVFSEMAKVAAALRAAALLRLVRDDLAWQMLRQRLTNRLRTSALGLSIAHRNRREGRVNGLHLLQLQFELVKLQGELLALAPEEHPAQLLHHQLQAFDLLGSFQQLGLILSPLLVQCGPLPVQFLQLPLLLFVLCEDERPQRFDVQCIKIGKRRTHRSRQYATLL
jgi:hypothetical protein